MRKILITFLIASLLLLPCSCKIQGEQFNDSTEEYEDEADYEEYAFDGYQYIYPNTSVKTRRVDDFLVYDFKDGICISRYLGSEKSLNIPEKIDNKNVLRLSCDLDENYCTIFSNVISSISLPKCLRYIDLSTLGEAADALQSISVARDNPYYSSYDGILYNHDKTAVIFVPSDYQKEELVFDDSLTHIKMVAIGYARNVKVLKIGKSLQLKYFNSNDIIDSTTFPYKIEEFYVSPDNPYLSSENGVLYNKDKTELISYPQQKPDEEYIVPKSVRKISDISLTNVRKLKTLTVHKNLETLDFQFDLEEFDAGQVYPGTSITTIKGYKGTVAESFAKKNNLEFVPLD